MQFPIATADNESLSGLSNISSIPGPQLEGGQGLTKESTASLQKKGLSLKLILDCAFCDSILSYVHGTLVSEV